MKKASINIDFPNLENELIEKWEENKLFEKIVDKNKNGERFRFLDGPITANNRAGVHHFWGRILKDITIKYNALKGKSCHYQNGFDAQGMWVEVNVEKELGLNGKPEIVEYGLDKFTNKCMERVNFFANEITNQSKRMGQFMDWENSYFTNTDENITAIWAFLKKCNENGWIIQKNRPMVWCPRCGTSISEHELSGSYSDVTHTAIFVKLPVKNKDYKIIAWTTTPWTLTANVALAVNPELDYVIVQDNQTKEKLVLGKNSLKVIKDYTILEEFKGEKLVGLEYETCFPELPMQNFVHKIYPWEEVDSTEGSCVVHIAPGCGAEDFDLGLRHNLPQICPINEQGVMLDDCGFIAGKKTTDVVEDVVNRLKNDNKLLYAHKYKHSYPHCWRCKTDLVYKLISTWYIKMDEIRPMLLKAIEDVEFKPEYAKKRMIDWLNNMGDWNISRSRFYGLPLPFYKCEKCGKVHIIGSLEELKAKAVNRELVEKLPNIHRPWIDDIKIKCDCGEEVSRISEVGDCWLDAGITPFSTKKFFSDKKFFEENFPSEFVCEMIEQIKLWFYSVLVMSVVLTGKAPYERIITYQYVKDENGDEFHKSGGNSLDADTVANKCGAEPIRYLFGGANPIYDMRFGYSLTDEAKKKLLGFWNIYVFFNTYAVIDNPNLKDYNFDINKACDVDRWLLSKVNKFVQDSDVNYAEYKCYNVIKDFENLVDDISNFYIRTNRKRFYNSGTDDQMNAYYVLYTAIKKIITVMSPILPFLTESIWIDLVKEIEKDEVQSIHLSSFPTADYIDNDLLDEVEKVRNVIYLAQKLRNEFKIKVKQPLNTLYLKAQDDYERAIKNFADLVKDEINIKNIEFVKEDKFNDEQLVLNFKKAGMVLKGEVNNVKNALACMSEEERKQNVQNFKLGKKVNVYNLELDTDLFELKIVAKEGFAIATLDNNLVALDINLSQDLIEEGILREIIRQIQVARKDANFEIADRITLFVASEDALTQKVINDNKHIIMQETLATKFEDCNAEYETKQDISSASISIKLKR